jgi:hypothetical protein
MANGAASPEIKQQGHEADHRPSNAKVNNCGAIPPLPNKPSLHGD